MGWLKSFLKKLQKVFCRIIKWITFAELSPEKKWVNEVNRGYNKFIEDIEKERRRTTRDSGCDSFGIEIKNE